MRNSEAETGRPAHPERTMGDALAARVPVADETGFTAGTSGTAFPEEDARSAFTKLVTMVVVVSLVTCFPSTSICYAAPFVALGWYLLDPRVLRRFLMPVFAMAAIGVISTAFDSAKGRLINPPGLLVGCITYAPWFVLYALLPVATGEVPNRLWRNFVSLVAIFVIGQSMLGIVEFAVTSDGDMVSGTYGVLNLIQGRRTISQVLFTFTMFQSLLLLACYPRNPLNMTALILGSIAVVMAQSGHQTIFLLASIPIVIGLSTRKFMLIAKGLAVVLLGAGLVSMVYPDTWDVARMWWDKVAVDDASPKRHIGMASVATLSEPKNMLLGTGVGQFSSRAALITSGTYLSVTLPRWIIGHSTYYYECMEEELKLMKLYGEDSAMAQPFCSAISVGVEFGIPLTLMLLLLVASLMIKNNRTARAGGEAARLAIASNIGILLFLLCCGIENYAEMVQALMIPLLLLLLVNMRIRHLEARSPEPILAE